MPLGPTESPSGTVTSAKSKSNKVSKVAPRDAPPVFSKSSKSKNIKVEKAQEDIVVEVEQEPQETTKFEDSVNEDSIKNEDPEEKSTLDSIVEMFLGWWA